MSFDTAKFLDALEGGVFKAALCLAAEKAGGTLGRLWRAGPCLFATVFDAQGRQVARVQVTGEPPPDPETQAAMADIDRDEAMAMADILALYRFRQHVIKEPPA